MTIFRPYLEDPEDDNICASFASTDSSPNAIFNASLRQLQRVVFDHIKLYYQAERYSAMLNPAVMHICNVVLADMTRKDARFYFLLCLKFWAAGVQACPVFADIAQGYLSLGLQNGCISAQEARRWKQLIADQTEAAAGDVACSVIVNFDQQVSMNNAYGDDRAHHLSQRFEELAMVDELTNLRQSESPQA